VPSMSTAGVGDGNGFPLPPPPATPPPLSASAPANASPPTLAAPPSHWQSHQPHYNLHHEQASQGSVDQEEEDDQVLASINSRLPALPVDMFLECTVRVFRQQFTLEDAIGSHDVCLKRTCV
jgi:hypothetical protein